MIVFFLIRIKLALFSKCANSKPRLINVFSDPDVSILKPLSADASAHAQSILAFLANTYKQRKIDAKKVFAAYDPKGTGLVPKDVVSI